MELPSLQPGLSLKLTFGQRAETGVLHPPFDRVAESSCRSPAQDSCTGLRHRDAAHPKLPSAKSFSIAVTEDEDRVSAMNDEKQGTAPAPACANTSVMLMPISKKPAGGNERRAALGQVRPRWRFAGRGVGDAAERVVGKTPVAGGGRSAGGTSDAPQRAVDVAARADPFQHFDVDGRATAGEVGEHEYVATVCNPMKGRSCPRTVTSPICWKNQKPMNASPLLSKRSAPA